MMDIRNQLDVTWLEEVGGGYPPGSLGHRLQATARADGALPPPEIVEQHGGFVLSGLQLDATIGFSEFLAGHAFTDGERNDLRTVLRMDFVTDPAAALASFDLIIGAFVQIPAMDPERRATERLRAHATTKLSEVMVGVETPATAMIERYNPVLHVDAEDGLVVTADALEAYWSLYDGLADITGLARSTDADRLGLSTELPALYPTWPRRIRAETGHARSRWVALRSSIRAMDDDRYRRFADSLQQQVTDPAGIAAAVTGFGMAAGSAALARRVDRTLAAVGAQSGKAER